MFGKRKNKWGLCACGWAFAFSLQANTTVQREVIEKIPWTFIVSNSHALVVGSLDGTVGDPECIPTRLVVPDQLSGVDVTEVEKDAFVKSMFWHGATRDKVVSIEISRYITKLSPESLVYFDNLQNVDVASQNPIYRSENGVLYRRGRSQPLFTPPCHPTRGKKLFEIDGRTLLKWRRTSSEDAVIPEHILYMGAASMANCHKIKHITLPGELKEIGDSAFRNCINLLEIAIPISVTRIGAFAFANCDSLQTFRVPAGVRRIERGTFQGCRSLREIILPSDLKEIDTTALQGCVRLRRIVFYGHNHPRERLMSVFKGFPGLIIFGDSEEPCVR